MMWLCGDGARRMLLTRASGLSNVVLVHYFVLSTIHGRKSIVDIVYSCPHITTSHGQPPSVDTTTVTLSSVDVLARI